MTWKQGIAGLINRALAPFNLRLDRASTYRSSLPVPLDGSTTLDHVRPILETPLQIIFLGTIDDRFSVPANLADRVRIFSLDAIAPGGSEGPATEVIKLTNVVAGASGKVEFVERVVAGVSSVLEPNPSLIEKYGLKEMYRIKQKHIVEAVTLAQLADRNQVSDWDCIKTDLEGLDFEVIRGLGERIRNTSVVQMELRFEPFYAGEPHFHEVAAWLHERGFEILDIRPERWRARTSHMLYETRGRAVFANTLFVNRDIERRSPSDIIRHALAVGLMGYANFAEFLLGRIASSHPRAVREIQQLLFSRHESRYLPMPRLPHATHGTDD